MVEMMLKHRGQLTAYSLQLAAADGCGTGSTSEPLAVSRKPTAVMRQIPATDKADWPTGMWIDGGLFVTYHSDHREQLIE